MKRMRKLFLALLLSVLLCGNVLASSVSKTIIAETNLDDDPTSVTGTYNISDFKKAAVFVDYDETEVGGGLSVAVTVDYSYDNTNWVGGYFYDFAGGSTLQTTESLAADGWYYLWLDTSWQIVYMRVTLTATGSDVDDIATVSAYLIGIK